MSGTRRQPIRWVRENIFVNDRGIPHAIWQLEGQPYGLGTVDQKNVVRARHQELFQNLTGDSILLGLVATVSPDDVAEKMLAGVKDPSDQWIYETEMTRQQQANEPSGSRLYFLIVPLSHFNVAEMAHRILQSAEDYGRHLAGFNPVAPTEREFETWTNRAAATEKKIPAAFRPRRVGINALRWIAHHMTTRGGSTAPAEQRPGSLGCQDWLNVQSCLPEPLVDEGDLESLDTDTLMSNAAAHIKALKRRYVRVDNGEDAPSYQQFGVIGFTPQAGFVFPGSEFINIAAELPLDIDFCIRITSTPAAKVRQKNRRAERILKEQYQQQGGTAGDITGGYTELDKSAGALREYTTELTRTEREVEVAATMIFSTAGAASEDAVEQMRMLRDLYGADEWEIMMPLGGQENLFWDCWPGAVESSTSREMKQITTGTAFSMGVPITSDALGGTHGFRIAANITTGRYSPIYVDLGGLAEKDISGSFAAVGELGSGKSVLLKTIASHSIDRGAQLVAVDHSDNREYAALAGSLTTANIIDFMDPHSSLDPLKIYKDDPRKAVAETLNLMVLLLGVSNTDDEGILLNDVLKTNSTDDHLAFSSLDEVRKYLVSDKIAGGDKDVAIRIARLMAVFADLSFGRVFFDPDLPPMDFDAQATVFCTRGMDLPTEEELASEEARREMTIPKRVGRASYAYLASIGSNIMYADDSRETLFLVDEAHHMTGSPEGSATIKTAIKTGRKHKGAVGLGTHTSDELGPKELRGLIPQRFLFRTRDPELARPNLRWLDPAYDNPEFLETVTKDLAPMNASGEVEDHRRGECLYRDQLNRVGKAKILIPRAENRAHTVLTSPPVAA